MDRYEVCLLWWSGVTASWSSGINLASLRGTPTSALRLACAHTTVATSESAYWGLRTPSRQSFTPSQLTGITTIADTATSHNPAFVSYLTFESILLAILSTSHTSLTPSPLHHPSST
ncbi:hypothetical protein BDV98DRAFT_268487 [Pterulicium gracile]|uniref:Uncharacterized protein n=1 Tax=Pterulicium gracile TaxID=1884261 RepID=A0A5C3Q853_9AGAR|nr:hypothetical protein BDV98DRAFT_268487 [Pterula gracilis]